MVLSSFKVFVMLFFMYINVNIKELVVFSEIFF